MGHEYLLKERTRRIWPMARRWWWVVIARHNGQTIATSETYTTGAACFSTASRFASLCNLGDAVRFEPLPTEKLERVSFDTV